MCLKVEEILTLIENDLPSGFVVMADNGATLTRENRITFDPLADSFTQSKVANTFSGDWVVHPIKDDLQKCTQNLLEMFKMFAKIQTQ